MGELARAVEVFAASHGIRFTERRGETLVFEGGRKGRTRLLGALRS